MDWAVLALSILRLVFELFFPAKEETARAVSDPDGIDSVVLADPDRLHSLGIGS